MKDKPHKDIGKQKFRIRKHYNVWVEYDVVADNKDEAIDAVIENGGVENINWQEGYHKDEPVEVYASDWNFHDSESCEKVAECVPCEDSDIDTGEEMLNYEDPEWTTDQFRWKDEEPKSKEPKNRLEQMESLTHDPIADC